MPRLLRTHEAARYLGLGSKAIRQLIVCGQLPYVQMKPGNSPFLLDQAKDLDLRSPHQDFFDPIWRQGWRTGDLLQIGDRRSASVNRELPTDSFDGAGADGDS